MAASIASRSQKSRETAVPETQIPPLQPGDVLTRPEFERRYRAQPEIKKAELIEGVVFMPSPVNAIRHGDPHFLMNTWLGVYCAATPGVTGSDNAILRLDLLNEPQPDVLLRLDPKYGGKTRVDSEGYLEGSPELTLEIAAGTSSYDMHQKRATYARHGIQEYIVVLSYEKKVVWYTLQDGSYREIQPDEQDILRSRVFPGLWLLPSAIWTNDLAALLAIVERGLAAPEHAAFLEEMQKES